MCVFLETVFVTLFACFSCIYAAAELEGKMQSTYGQNYNVRLDKINLPQKPTKQKRLIMA